MLPAETGENLAGSTDDDGELFDFKFVLEQLPPIAPAAAVVATATEEVVADVGWWCRGVVFVGYWWL